MLILHIKDYLKALVLLHMCNKLYKGFCGSRGSHEKSDKLPQVVSLASVSVGDEDYKFENENNLGVWV